MFSNSYSEEVFSQQSRKMSGSSSCSEDLDFPFSSHHQPGPSGDGSHLFIDLSKLSSIKHDTGGIAKSELINLKAILSEMLETLSSYNLNVISKEDLELLRTKLSQYDLEKMFRFDLSSLKADMQNKYHAELEILREDCENRVDALNVEHKNRMESLERKYAEKIESLKCDLDEALRNVDMNIGSTVQEVRFLNCL